MVSKGFHVKFQIFLYAVKCPVTFGLVPQSFELYGVCVCVKVA